MTHDATRDKAGALLRLHHDPALLTVVNVWDVISARTVAANAGSSRSTSSHLAIVRACPRRRRAERRVSTNWATGTVETDGCSPTRGDEPR